MRWLFLTSILYCTMIVQADEIIQITWKTQQAAPPPQLARPAADFLPVFRLAMVALPESAIVTLALSQPAMLGLTSAQAATMRPLVAARYELIAKSPVYSSVPSALPCCFAEKRLQLGMALMHVPTGASKQTPVIVFMHGYGGSFLWYQHLLAEHFPKHVIVCPVYGISPATIPSEYVRECLQAAGMRLGWPVVRPSLLGLSAGGFAACYLYTRNPERFAQMICLASFPPIDTLAKFPRDAQVAFIAGGAESFVATGDFARRVAQVKATAPATQSFLVPKADHFFLLTHTGVTMTKLHEWLDRTITR